MRVGAGVLLFAGVVEALKMPAVFCGSGIVRPGRAAPLPFMKDDGEQEKKKGIDLSGLMQVMSMGAGAPMLGDLKKTNFDKPESEGGAALQFELEANNFDLDQRGTCALALTISFHHAFHAPLSALWSLCSSTFAHIAHSTPCRL